MSRIKQDETNKKYIQYLLDHEKHPVEGTSWVQDESETDQQQSVAS